MQLSPGQKSNVTLQFRAPPDADPVLLPIFSGFISVTNSVNKQVVQVPYAGMVGDYKNARIIVQNNPSGIATRILNSNNVSISNTQEETLIASESIRIRLVTTWASRRVSAEVFPGESEISANSSASYGYVFDDSNDKPVVYTNLVRNAAVAGSHAQFYGISWSGQVSVSVRNGSLVGYETTSLPDGRYKIRFSALQHFGNPENPNDFDIYESPTFKLIRLPTTSQSPVTISEFTTLPPFTTTTTLPPFTTTTTLPPFTTTTTLPPFTTTTTLPPFTTTTTSSTSSVSMS
ncbi:unnamed protein product, partial [Rotaria sp. Silwood2]